ncbi:MAG TPA: hypothetical protein VK559_00365 [Ferruginibacter sp.]|nr:hypothetical protein [Ferruginibacter sp.]
MDSSEDEMFKHYNRRLKEFDDLLKDVKSHTLVDIIIKAKNKTEQSLEELLKINKTTAVYIAAHNIHVQERLKKIKDFLELCQEKIEELKGLELPHDFKKTLMDFHLINLEEAEKRIKIEADINTLTINTFSLCHKEFSRILLQLIFRPPSAKFHYESIIDVLNYIATKLLPGLDEAKILSNFPVAIRKKQFAKSGDKILTYIEEYIDVIEKWETLGSAYIKIIEG